MIGKFSKIFSQVNDENMQLTRKICKKANELQDLLMKIDTREMSLAQTNLEQSIMWAIKAITLYDDQG